MWQSIAYYSWLAVESVLGVFGIRLYEEPRYDVIDRIGNRVEIRRDGPRLAAEVDLTSPGDAGRSQAFQLLFAYIAGANRGPAFGQDAIAMTTPVEVSGKELVAMTVPVETLDSADAGHMRFFLPSKYSLDAAPRPLNPAVRLDHCFARDDRCLAFFRLGHRCRRAKGRANRETRRHNMAAHQRALYPILRRPVHSAFSAEKRSRGRDCKKP